MTDQQKQLIKDYEEAAADTRRLTRELDIALHGKEGAAKQASLCDLIAPAKDLRTHNAELTATLEKVYAEATKGSTILSAGAAKIPVEHASMRASHMAIVKIINAAIGGK